MQLIHFAPVYQERVWGGRALAESLGRELPGDAPIGESWELVDRPEAQSVDVASGRTFRELLEHDAEALMGPGWNPARPFPVLVKWLDCAQRLSLQVHPAPEVAERLGGEPKTEWWYIAEAAPAAALIVGLRRDTTRDEFEQAVRAEKLEPLLHRFPVEPGQSMLLNSGRIHAIDAGNLILEIQQNSDTTYRVYDWGRVGLDGKPRQLHLKESLEAINFDDFEPQPRQAFSGPGEVVVAESDEFRIRQINLEPGKRFEHPAGRQPLIVSVVRGSVFDEPGERQFGYGANVLAPFAAETRVRAEEPAALLITDRFVVPGR